MPETVILHGHPFEAEYIEDSAEWALGFDWRFAEWRCRDALVDHGAQTLYTGQRYDPSKVELVRGGWKHDHCAICWWTLWETEDPESGTGYTDGIDWLCVECYEKLVLPRLTERD